jgi:hypothetical protein
MSPHTTLKILFSCILVSMIVCTSWATLHQSMFQYGGLSTGPDRYWNIATLLDAYFGFLTFYFWVFYKERRWLPRTAWFIAIMALGNMAMACYVLVQLLGLSKDTPASAILAARNS